MSSFKSHRIIIASLFLPETSAIGEVSPTPTHDAASGLLSGSTTPGLRTPGFTGRPVTAEPISIVEDLKDKVIHLFHLQWASLRRFCYQSKGQATPTPTPGPDIANPFFAEFANKNRTPERLQKRIFRKPSRSSSRKPGLERTKWHIETNAHCNGGLRNAVNSVSDRLKRKLWVGVLGTPTDKMSTELRDDIDVKMRKEASCLPVWIPDSEFSKCYDEFCHRVCLFSRFMALFSD